ncbi:MAG: hypothetical protein ACW97A_09020 [Candidatus Thorarchaeota archaeon]
MALVEIFLRGEYFSLGFSFFAIAMFFNLHVYTRLCRYACPRASVDWTFAIFFFFFTSDDPVAFLAKAIIIDLHR